MSDYPRNPNALVLLTLAGLCVAHTKLYCYPSQATILELMEKRYGRRMSARSLNRHLGALERDGWLRRQRRHETAQDGSLRLHSTLYLLIRRAVTALRNLTSNVWSWSTGALKSLTHIALPVLAETLTRDGHSYVQQRRKPPPRT